MSEKSESARQGAPDDQLSRRPEISTAPRREPSVEEIVQHCREVAAAAGMSWIHDLVFEEFERLSRRAAA